MKLTNGINFDNTLSVQEFANSKKGREIIDYIHPMGKQKYLYNVGDMVSFSGVECATIQERYMTNGYCYYTCIWTTGKRKVKEFFSRERQQDLTLIEK